DRGAAALAALRDGGGGAAGGEARAGREADGDDRRRVRPDGRRRRRRGAGADGRSSPPLRPGEPGGEAAPGGRRDRQRGAGEGQLRLTSRALWRSRGGAWEEQEVPRPALEYPDDVPTHSLAFGLELRDFARSIREGREPAVSGRYGREIVRVLTACETSSETG